jgi:hypothetical protein
MSCCGGNKNTMNNFMPTTQTIKEFYGNFNPDNYYDQNQTYVIDPDNYYAPPWPADRTNYDMEIQKNFNPSSLPDFINYTQAKKVDLDRKSVLNGNMNYNSYSY